jgi:RsiW-degrading membrane proteinase PrsW (M82 family)
MNFGSESMAGLSSQCMKCGVMVQFPTLRRRPTSVLLASSQEASPTAPAGAGAVESGAAAAVAPPVPKLPRRGIDLFYGVLLLALVPLVTALQEDRLDFQKRLDQLMQSHPELKDRIEEIMASEYGDFDDLFKVLPGHKLDDRAHLPRDSRQHEIYAAISAGVFFLFVGVFLARGITASWKLVLVAAFTATFGVAVLFIFQDLYGGFYLGMLEGGEKAGDGLLLNLIGFTLGVGFSEELVKALPIIFYVRTHRDASSRGASLWGMASGVGFGVAEGVMYSVRYYNGVSPVEAYLTRFASCVALHAVWSASVGITLFQARYAVSKAVSAILYLDFKEKDFDWGQVVLPALQVLGVAMVLHGLYDTLLTQQMTPAALVMAVVSLAWLGYQIEAIREQEGEALAEAAAEAEATPPAEGPFQKSLV